MMAAGGTQLKKVLEDDSILVWKFHVDWENPANTKAVGPEKMKVAPYHYLCGGQLTNCVPQPGTNTRLDSQGDKIMARLVYRRIGNRESVVAVHSVNTSVGRRRRALVRIPRQTRTATSCFISRALTRRISFIAGWRARRSIGRATSALVIRSAGRQILRASVLPGGWRKIRSAS